MHAFQQMSAFQADLVFISFVLVFCVAYLIRGMNMSHRNSPFEGYSGERFEEVEYFEGEVGPGWLYVRPLDLELNEDEKK